MSVDVRKKAAQAPSFRREFLFAVEDLPSKSKLRINGRIQVSDIDKSLIDPLQQEQTLFT